jgi:glycosyltransferase involved in cell wall biosynthesis
MRIVAIIAARNEELHIRRCIEQWIADGCDVILIDNESSDGTVPIARTFLGRGLLSIEHLSWHGSFSLREQLLLKRRIAAQLDHDWLVHADADEWHCSPWGGTFVDAIRRVAAEGSNCIELDEYSFVPWPDENFAHTGYHRQMLTYYAFEPSRPYLMRAWRRDIEADNIERGGHVLTSKARLSPSSVHFILRHYMALSLDHACHKYVDRRFDLNELADGWHGTRATVRRDDLRLRPSPYLRRLSRWDAIDFDKSRPAKQFYWEWKDQDEPTSDAGRTRSVSLARSLTPVTPKSAAAPQSSDGSERADGDRQLDSAPEIEVPTSARMDTRFARFGFQSPLQPRQTHERIKQLKLDLITSLGSAASIRDFGGLWGVDGLYLLEGAKALGCSFADMVDVTPRPEFDEKVAELRRIMPLEVRMIHGDFRDSRLFLRLAPVEVALLYDVLLHQDNVVEVIKNVASKTTRFICVAQPVMKEELFALPNGAVNLQFYPEELKDQLRYSGWWEKEPRTDYFSPAFWMWGQTTSYLTSIFHGYGWEANSLDTYEASEFWNYALIRFGPRQTTL